MKKLLLLVAIICAFTQLNAQELACIPDTTYQDASPGAYPLPLNEGEGGLAEFPACINEPYELVFTIKLGDSVSVAGIGSIDVFSATIPTTDAVTGLPVGLNYLCNPPNCVFPDTLLGCIVVTGTPTAENPAGDYPLVIRGSALLDGFGDFPLEFPGLLAAGEYILPLNDTGGCEAVSTSIPSYLKSNIELSNMPNPVQTTTMIEMTSLIDGDFQFKVFDMTGKSIHAENVHLNVGYNTLSYDVSGLGEGMYIYTLGDGNAMIYEKMLVSRK